jgi:hypothetical protein
MTRLLWKHSKRLQRLLRVVYGESNQSPKMKSCKLTIQSCLRGSYGYSLISVDESFRVAADSAFGTGISLEWLSL